MPSLIDASKIPIAGFNSNSAWNDMNYGETSTIDIRYTAPNGDTVAKVTGNIITISNNNIPPVAPNGYVIFTNILPDSTFATARAAYKVASVSAGSIALVVTPPNNIQGAYISYSTDLTTATFQLRVKEYTASVDNRNGKFIIGEDFDVKSGAVQINFDAYVFPIDAVNGWIRIALPTTAFTDIPSPAGTLSDFPVLYAGSITSNLPPNVATGAPAATKKQRIGWLIYSSLE